LQSDLEQLGEKIEQIGDVSLIMIDPLNAFFGDQVDTHKMAAVRSVLARGCNASLTDTTLPSLASCTRPKQLRAARRSML